jgi:hypothetical protein
VLDLLFQLYIDHHARDLAFQTTNILQGIGPSDPLYEARSVIQWQNLEADNSKMSLGSFRIRTQQGIDEREL